MASGDPIGDPVESLGSYSASYNLLQDEDSPVDGGWIPYDLISKSNIEVQGTGSFSFKLYGSNKEIPPNEIRIAIGGSPAEDDTVTLTIDYDGLEGGPFEYTILAGETASDIAQKIVNMLVGEATFNSLSFSAEIDASNDTIVVLKVPLLGKIKVTVGVTGGVTATKTEEHLGTDTGIAAITTSGWQEITKTYRWLRAVLTTVSGSVSARLHGVSG